MTEEQHNKDYLKGFNDGYIIAEHLPEVADSLSALENDAPRLQGLKDGGRQYALDKVRAFHPRMNVRLEMPQDVERAKEQDKDDPER